MVNFENCSPGTSPTYARVVGYNVKRLTKRATNAVIWISFNMVTVRNVSFTRPRKKIKIFTRKPVKTFVSGGFKKYLRKYNSGKTFPYVYTHTRIYTIINHFFLDCKL